MKPANEIKGKPESLVFIGPELVSYIIFALTVHTTLPTEQRPRGCLLLFRALYYGDYTYGEIKDTIQQLTERFGSGFLDAIIKKMAVGCNLPIDAGSIEFEIKKNNLYQC